MTKNNQNKRNTESEVNEVHAFVFPIGLLEYMAQDQVFSNKNKCPRQQAFFDLVRRSKMIIDGNDSSAANYAQLCKHWNWNRPGLMAFIDKLDEYRLLNFEVNMRNKVVTLKPELFLQSKLLATLQESRRPPAFPHSPLPNHRRMILLVRK